jgi:hypothetical protein
MKLEIAIMEQKGNFTIVMCGRKTQMTNFLEHGETKIIRHYCKVKRVKFYEGEDF